MTFQDLAVKWRRGFGRFPVRIRKKNYAATSVVYDLAAHGADGHISPVVTILEIDFRNRFVGASARRGHGFVQRRHRENAAAARDHLAVFPARTGMENLHILRGSTLQ